MIAYVLGFIVEGYLVKAFFFDEILTEIECIKGSEKENHSVIWVGLQMLKYSGHVFRILPINENEIAGLSRQSFFHMFFYLLDRLLFLIEDDSMVKI